MGGYSWVPDGKGVLSGGEVGGDVQDGDSYSVRFCNPRLPGCLITVTYYAVQYPEWGTDPERGAEWGVERKVEWSIRGPHGDDPWWVDDTTGLVNDTSIHSQAEAETLARQWAGEDVGGAGLYGTWDGRPT